MVHLHTHDHFSALDGLSTPQEYAHRAQQLGQVALAQTNHGSLGGAFQHWRACKSVGIKPIIGIEFYVAPHDRRDHSRVSWKVTGDEVTDVGASGAALHLTVIAKSAEGLRNLYRLQAESYSTGFYGKPRIDFEVLRDHGEGLIVLTGCAGGHVATRLRMNQWGEAREVVLQLIGAVGEENVYVEVMDHGIDTPDLNDARLLEQLIELSKLDGLPIVATNDAHYCREGDSRTHDRWLCLQTGAKESDEKRFRFNGTGFHLKSRAEMSPRLPVESLDATLEIAERIGSYDELFTKTIMMPEVSR